MKSKIIITLLSVIIFAQFVFAKGVGTTMFQILQMPMTAYDAALANTYVSGEVSALSNPSLIPFFFRSLTLSHVVYLENMRYSVGDINLPLGGRSGINFSFCYFDSGDMDRIKESGNSYKTGGTFNATDKVFNLSYGTRLGSVFSAGLSLKYVEQNIDDVSYSNYLFGLNGLCFLSNTVFVTAGIQNFGSDVKGYSMPTSLYCGLTATVNETTTWVIQADDYYNEDLCEFKIALEKKVDKLAMRFGYIIPSKEYNGTNNSFITNLTLGLGIDLTNFIVDYAWLPKGDLGNVHMFTVRINF